MHDVPTNDGTLNLVRINSKCAIIFSVVLASNKASYPEQLN